MDFLSTIENFDRSQLKTTPVTVRHTDGSVTVMTKEGDILSDRGTVVKPEPNFSQHGFILNPDPDLQIGRIHCEGFELLFGSQDVARDLACLIENKVTHIINLVSNITPNLFPKQFEYLSLVAYDDMEFCLRTVINQSIDFLRQVRRTGGCCFVHCDAGRCRAPAIIMAYLIKEEEYSYERAFFTVNNARNVAINVNFRAQLQRMSD